ncbi:MAG: tetratricopeptide repeat protein [Ignavibacteria bacterium]|nr:tetratricopeptide repeat protein [Ignavibacteria bacterium]
MNILTLENAEEQNKKLLKLQGYLFKENFKKVIKEGVIYLKEFPEEPNIYTMLAIAYSETGRIEKAFELLKEAEKKFPEDYEVLFQMGKLYEDILDFDRAIEYFYKSFNITPAEYRGAKADCLNDIAALKYRQGKEDEAIAIWKNALLIDPAHSKAKNNLNHFNDTESGDIDIEFFLNEFHKFEDIHKEKYFEMKGKRKFDTMKEEKHFLKMIAAVWIADIMPLSEEMKNMDSDKLISMYREMDIDYSGPIPVPDPIIDEDNEKILKERFPFLPESGFMTVLAAGPALDYAGLSQEKLTGFAQGKIPMEAKDIEKLKWAYSVGEVLLELGNAESKKKQTELFDKFIKRLNNLLSPEDTRLVLDKIISEATGR